MKKNVQKYTGVLLVSSVLIGGIATAAVTPMPTISNTFAVAGQVIKSADINKLAEALNVLDMRTNGATPVDADHLANKGYVDSTEKFLSPVVYSDHANMVTAAQNAAENSVFVYQGKEYKAVKSPNTEKLWLDRNLGASKACETTTDPLCFGDYYQWGRDNDGHEYVTVTQSLTGQAATITPNHSQFLKGSLDWSTGDADGALRTAFLSKTDGTGICPAGWRVPTEADITAEQGGAAGVLKAGSSHFLNVPLAGNRNNSNGAMNNSGVNGSLWSASADADKARNLYINPASSGWHSYNRGHGFSVRCLKD